MEFGRSGLILKHGPKRPAIPFRSVNRRNDPKYDQSMQRHHLLPCQLLSARCFGRMFDDLGARRVGFEDFRANGMLLPSNEEAALRTALPLHRGPHRDYNEMVIERVGCIEHGWSDTRLRDQERAMEEAIFRLALLQKALRKRLLTEQRRLVLNRKDPLGTGFDFSELDAMAEILWSAT